MTELWLILTVAAAAPDDGPSVGQLISDAPLWIRIAFAALGGIGTIVTAVSLWRKRDEDNDSEADRIEKYLERAETELVNLRAERIQREARISQLEFDVQRAAEREAGLKATIDTLRGLIDNRGGR